MTASATIEKLHDPSDTDRARIAILVGQLSSHPPDVKTVAVNVDELLADPRSVLFVARSEAGEIVGMASGAIFTKTVGHEARLNDVVVDESARGQGLGRRLTQMVVDWAWAHGADALQFTSRPSRVAANALYQSMGFKPKETNVYDVSRPE